MQRLGPGSHVVRSAAAAALLALALSLEAAGSEPNPPTWPASVQVFSPLDSPASIQAAVQSAHAVNGGQQPTDHGQFSPERFAFLFKPGLYNVEVPVGYYTQVAGLGTSPSDVVFTSAKGVYCEEGSPTVSPGALNTFWRSAENFETRANFPWEGGSGMMWAAAQASPLRRVLVAADLLLYQTQPGDRAAGYSSGGFLGNSRVIGAARSGSQQQFLTRNSEVGSWPNGVWNMVFVGTRGAPLGHCGRNDKVCSLPIVNVDATPVIAEKPFISINAEGGYVLNIPQAQMNRSGVDWSPAPQVDFESVYVARNDTDTAGSINAKLGQGLHIVLSPGIYLLEDALSLQSSGQVLLGLGLATLVAQAGKPAVVVGNVDGVRVAGVLLQAGAEASQALLQWGTGSYPGNSSNPGVLSDVFVRIGGPLSDSQVQAKVMVQINSGHVLGDNLWLWRADHTEGGLVKNGDNPCEVGLVVNGDDVAMYGLQIEHTLQDLLQWNGERGATYFFQAEMPYDVNQANYGDKGYAGYRVASSVVNHSSFGAGVYHYFRDNHVVVHAGIVAPPHLEDSFVSPLSVFLNGKGVIKHVINDKGGSTSRTDGTNAVPVWLCPQRAKVAPRPLAATDLDHVLMAKSWGASCSVGASVICPVSGVGCAGNSCCPDQTTCPSASEDYQCCPKWKTVDCVNVKPGPSPQPGPPLPPSPPAPPGQRCNVGDAVACPGSTFMCAGDQCCLDGSTCPSAAEAYAGCALKKKSDCVNRAIEIT